MLRKNIANCFTALRIICTIIMLFLKTLTLPFLVIYTIAGMSDVIDGYLARKLNPTLEESLTALLIFQCTACCLLKSGTDSI